MPRPANGACALQGVRVLDFTWVHAGPAATRVLADQGAETIKVESSYALAVVGGPSAGTPRGLGQRHNWNAGKKSIALNMRHPKAVAIAKRLVEASDVVAENFSARVMAGWGLDYDSLHKIKPDIIMLSMSGMGRAGPWKDYVTYGQTLQAWSGFTWLTGFPEADPSGPASAYSDAVAGMAGAQAVMLALLHRARTGEGQQIDLAQFESLSVLMETLFLDLDVNGREVHRSGNRLPHSEAVPHGAYRCRGDDRWIAISVFTDAEWEACARAIGSPGWARDSRFSTASSRVRFADELDRLVETWTIERSPEEAMHLLQSAGVAAGVVQTGADMQRDPHLRERGFFRQVPDDSGTPRTIEGAPYMLSDTPGGPVRGASEFAAHQTYVTRDLLGMSDEEAAQCAIDGAFE